MHAYDRPFRAHGAVAALPPRSEQAAQHHRAERRAREGVSSRVRIVKRDVLVRDALKHVARRGIDAERLRPGVLCSVKAKPRASIAALYLASTVCMMMTCMFGRMGEHPLLCLGQWRF